MSAITDEVLILANRRRIAKWPDAQTFRNVGYH